MIDTSGFSCSYDYFSRYAGKTVKVYFVDGFSPITGKYAGYTPAYDNDPEVATIDIEGDCHYSLDVPDIDHIDIVE